MRCTRVKIFSDSPFHFIIAVEYNPVLSGFCCGETQQDPLATACFCIPSAQPLLLV